MSFDPWVYAALSELAYRRDGRSFPLELRQILSNSDYEDFEDDARSRALLDEWGLETNGEFIIGRDSGLTAYVVKTGNDYIIVFRGTGPVTLSFRL